MPRIAVLMNRLARTSRVVALVSAALVGVAAAEPAQVEAADHLQQIVQMQRWTHLPRQDIVAFSPEVTAAFLRRGAPGKRAGLIEGVELQGEVMDEELAKSRGWRSMRLRLDVQCQDGKTQARRFEVFADHDRKGAARTLPAPVGWIHPTPQAYLSAVVASVCGPSQAADPVQIATAAPILSPPAQATRAEGSPKAARATSAQLASAKVEPAPPRQALSAPQLIAVSTSPAMRPITGSAGVSVQISAASSEGGAQAALNSLYKIAGLSLSGLNAHVDPADVGEHRVYRALVSGLATHAEARAFCASVLKGGGACFVR